MPKIDKYSLDDEWIDLVDESEKASDAYADAIQERDDYEAEVLKPFIADLERKIREDPKDYDLDKVTDKAVQAIIDSDENVIEKRKKYIELDHAVNRATGKNVTISRRSKALEYLTNLFFRDYYYSRDILGDVEKEKIQSHKTNKAVDESLNSANQVNRLLKLKERKKK